MYSVENYSEFKASMQTLDEKNKMPWPAVWILKLKKVILELKINYINDSLIEEHKTKKKV